MMLNKKPKYRYECINGVRPCPWASCRYNTFINITPNGKLKVIYEDIDDFKNSNCILDIVEENGPMTYEVIGEMLNLTRERARQVSDKALRKMRPKIDK